jgi:spore coat polysaccharide biosynthesis protein SpsF (cytidylyltransferase family)
MATGHDPSRRVVAIVQARVGSTRLPGKVLVEIGGRRMLDWVLGRLRGAATLDDVVVATSTLAEDDVLERHAREHGFEVVRGEAHDLLSRYVAAAAATDADVVVRVTSDCPFIDPALVDTVVRALLDADDSVDYVSNAIEPRTFPRGLDVEALSRRALLAADRLDHDPLTREHVTPFLRESGVFGVRAVTNDEDLSSLRWTVDTEADLELVRTMAAHFQDRLTVSWRELLDAWRANPRWARINAHVEQKRIARNA